MNQTAENNGVQGGNVLVVSGELDLQQMYTELWMPDGKVIRILTAQLGPDAGRSDALTGLADEDSRSGSEVDQEMVIPVVEERLQVERQSVETATVRLHKVVQEYQETLDEPLAVRTFDIERVVLNRPVEVAPSVRHEGDVTIYPVVEEQMILTKQLILKEEVRVTKRDTERRDTQVVTLRREHVIVEREAHDGSEVKQSA